MAKPKYYAVRKGHKPGIYSTWTECELQVKGFSNSEYKSFPTLEEADKFMSETDESFVENSLDVEEINKQIDNLMAALKDNEVIAFVDGSYNDTEKKAGYGVIIITSDGNKERLYRAITEKLDQSYVALWNIAPELEAVKQAVGWAILNGKSKITVFHDLEGTAKWANGEFKAKNPFTKDYVDFIQEKRKLIDVDFIKVPAHSGVELNEEVDELAKRSLLEKGFKSYDNGSVYFVGLTNEDWRSVVELLNEENSELENDTPNIVLTEEVIDNRTKLILKQGRNKVTINCYRPDKSYVQGKHSALLQRIIATAICMLKTGESVVETYNRYHAVDISREEVEVRFDELLPNYSGEKTGKNYANLMSAVYNTMLTGYRPDYTHLITPVFRAYEFYLHRILCDKMGLNTTNSNGTNNFSYFSKNAIGGYVCNTTGNGSLVTDQTDYLNDLYTNYNKVRHPYSHWAYEDVDCAVITEMTEARNLIEQGLNLIDKYYSLF